ncbi:MAG: O-antigen ligase family protein [Paraprevotella sp.]|nr:O-antigen ligase family protein [Paraprevotella sp.]
MGKSAFGSIDLWVALCVVCFAGNVMAVSHTPCAGTVLHVGAWMALYMLLRCAPLARIPNKAWAYLCAAWGCLEAGLGMMQLTGLRPSGHHLYAMTGTFFNPAPFGAFLAVMLVVVLATYKREGGKALGVAAVVLLIVLPAAWSRAALLSCAACMALLYRAYMVRYWKAVVACSVVTLVVLYFLKRGSADSRALMFIVSFRIWMKHFWLGTGVGGYLHALGEGQSEYFATHPDSVFIPSVGVADLPFCEPIRLAVEMGAVGLVLVTGVLALTAWRLWRSGHPLFYALLALLVFSLFSYPFNIPVFGVILAVIVATAANVGEERLVSAGKVCSLLGAIVLGFTVFTFLIPKKKAEKEYEQFSHLKDEAFIKAYYELLPKLNDNPKFLFNFGSLLRDAGRHNDSNAMLRQGTLLSVDPMFPILMGRNYEDMQEYGMADSLYHHAFHMVPNRIYPLYRRMKLYETMEDSTRMTDMAKRITDFKVKVESPATRDMKKEAKRIIQEKGNIAK